MFCPASQPTTVQRGQGHSGRAASDISAAAISSARTQCATMSMRACVRPATAELQRKPSSLPQRRLYSSANSTLTNPSTAEDLFFIDRRSISDTQNTQFAKVSGPAVKKTANKVGVLLLNLGGPDKLEDVQPFLYNLFADPDIIRLPSNFQWLQPTFAEILSSLRAPKSAKAYESIGGGSPLRKITEKQAIALEESLRRKGTDAKVYVGMRYWHPFTEEAVKMIKADNITTLVVLPLYPQFSISTSGSSLRLLENMFRKDEYMSQLQHTVIPSWYQREGYVKAMADMIQMELEARTPNGNNQVFSDPENVNIFFSAHGVPKSYVTEAGDPYQVEMEECVALIMNELRSRNIQNPYTLAYQSRVGPVEWLKPYTDDTIRDLGEGGAQGLLAVPISFVSEHIETLEEIDMEYRELALESGIKEWRRVPALNMNKTFIDDLSDAVLEALPYVGTVAPTKSGLSAAVVPSGSVGDILSAYDRDRDALPAPVKLWEWGWTKSAEMWNGRLAMLALVLLLILRESRALGQ